MANRKGKSLTEGEILFIDRYLSNGYDRKEATVAAGFKTDNPARYGGGVLKRELVQKEIKRLIEKKREDFFIDEMDIKTALWKEANDHGKGATQAGRVQALVHLGKTIGMFTTEKDGSKSNEKKGLTINITNYGEKQVKDVTGEVIENLAGQDTKTPIKELELD